MLRTIISFLSLFYIVYFGGLQRSLSDSPCRTILQSEKVKQNLLSLIDINFYEEDKIDFTVLTKKEKEIYNAIGAFAQEGLNLLLEQRFEEDLKNSMGKLKQQKKTVKIILTDDDLNNYFKETINLLYVLRFVNETRKDKLSHKEFDEAIEVILTKIKVFITD